MNSHIPPQEFFVAGGTLWREAPSYLTRPVDDELLQRTLAGEFCNILAARQMGKSSLMVRTAGHLQKAGVRTAIIDISTLGGGISTPDEWFFGFVDELAVQLDLNADVTGWWESHAAQNAVQRFSNFLRDVILEEISSPITIFIDEIDSALGMAFTDDFFAAIRAAYNARASNPAFQRLTFVLIGVARPADLIRDRTRTPYNIGTHINLPDFTLPELALFLEVFEKAYPGHGAEILQNILDWTNGQPYLTQKLCAALISAPYTPPTSEVIAETVHRLFFTDEARKESNLRAIRDRIESSPNKVTMLQIYGKILEGKLVQDEERSPAKNELKLTGLVRPTSDGKLEIRNRIYRKVFDRPWVRKNLPPTRTRQVAIFTSLLAVIAILIAGYALYQQRQQASLTFAEQFRTSNSPEVKLTSLARLLALDERAAGQALELYTALPHEGKRALFTGLSNPQNVAPELVTVITAVYQNNRDNAEGNQLLNDMRLVLGKIGATGAPSLKTEIEFWLKGREEAENQNYNIAISFYDSAWAESENQNRGNVNILFDRAVARIALGEHAPALDDLQTVWDRNPSRQGEVTALINADPALAFYSHQNSDQYPVLLAFITPVSPTLTPTPTFTPTPESTSTPTVSPTLTLSPTPTATRPPSPFTGWIAYVLGEGTDREVFIHNPLTGEKRQITSNSFTDEAPSFSPNNWRLVYASNRSADGWQLYAYDMQLGTEQKLTSFEGEARFPAWSPVDARIVFEGRDYPEEGKTNLWMLDVMTGMVEQLTSGGADSRPGWAPDGKRIVFGRASIDTNGDGEVSTVDHQDIFLLDLETRTETNLANTPANDDFNFTWSPDGAWIAFTSVREDINGDGVKNLDDSRDLYRIRVDGSLEEKLPLAISEDQEPNYSLFSPVWSPDGQDILLLLIFGNGQNEIWRFDVSSAEMTMLTDRGAFFQPSFAREPGNIGTFTLGEYDLTFVSDRDGEYGVYVMDTQNVENWQVIPRPAGFERTWWPTFCGEAVYFEAQDVDGLNSQWVFSYSSASPIPVKFDSTLNPARLGVPRCSPEGDTLALSVHIPTEFNGWLLGIKNPTSEYVLSTNPSFGYVTWSNREDFFLSMTIIDGEFYVLETSNFQGNATLETVAKGKYPALAPTGNRYVYLCSNQSYLCIQTLGLNDGKLLQEVVSIKIAGDDLPVTAMWSADGQWIYFASAADGDWDIYRVRPDGSELQNLTAAWNTNEMMPALRWGE